VEKVRRLRAMGSLCRQQAAYNSMNKWKLLAEAEDWEHLADLELSSYFQECNAVSSNEMAQPQAITSTNDTRLNTIAQLRKSIRDRSNTSSPYADVVTRGCAGSTISPSQDLTHTDRGVQPSSFLQPHISRSIAGWFFLEF
jgi:hypothetical protein